MDGHPDLLRRATERLMRHITEKFGWRHLTGDVIMDVGCGEEGNCGKAILEKFPDVNSVVGIDNDGKAVRNFRLRNDTRMECYLGDIEKRDSLQKHEGLIDKVISTDVFHHLLDKVEAFRNVHRLLKPGGEAAILFLKESLLYDWLTKMLENAKWKNAFKCQYIEDTLKSGFRADQYQEILENMGFKVFECGEEPVVIPYLSEQICKDALYKMAEAYFHIRSRDLEEFKEDCFQTLLKLSARDEDGQPCYRATEFVLLLIKPTEGAKSETKE